MKANILTIIVTYNGIAWIDKCLKSLYSSQISTDIVLIDNASSDGICEFLYLNHPNIKLIENKLNIGFGKANNIGFNYALKNNYDYVFLLNQDTYIYPDSISNLLLTSLSIGDNNLVSPLHLNYNGKEVEAGCLQFIKDGLDETWYNDILLGSSKCYYEIKFINAAAWFIPIHLLKKVGGFDPIFQQYGEDNDWIDRCKYHGHSSFIDFNSRICHYSNYKTWQEVSLNTNRVFISYIVQLKSLHSSFISNLFILFKREFDNMTTFFLFGNFKRGFILLTQLLRILFWFSDIKLSRKFSQKSGAFL